MNKYESGERRLDLIELAQVCAVLGVPLVEFVAEFDAASAQEEQRLPTFDIGGQPRDKLLRDVLDYAFVDAGHGWLIFALPPAELAVHPADADDRHELYVMCDDLTAEMRALEEKGVECSDVEEARRGSVTKIRLPGGGAAGLYQPKHPSPLIPTPTGHAPTREPHRSTTE